MQDSSIQSGYKFTEEGEMVRTSVQDVGALIEDNKQERLSGDNDQSGKNARKFASVPLLVLERLKTEQGIDYHKVGIDPDHTGRFFLWLRENPYFRTSEATLGNGNQYLR